MPWPSILLSQPLPYFPCRSVVKSLPIYVFHPDHPILPGLICVLAALRNRFFAPFLGLLLSPFVTFATFCSILILPRLTPVSSKTPPSHQCSPVAHKFRGRAENPTPPLASSASPHNHLDQSHLVAPAPQPPEVLPHLLQAHRRLRKSIKLIAAVAGMVFFVGRRQPLKRIKPPNLASRSRFAAALGFGFRI